MTEWDPDGSGPEPELLVASGEFTVAGDIFAHYIAAWDGSSWLALGSEMSEGSFDSYAQALTVYNDDLIAGGYFTSAGGVPCDNIARWNGSVWQPLGTGMNGSVSALTVYDDELIAGGGFTTAGGVSCNSIARWDGSSWQPLGEGMGGGGSYGAFVCGLVMHEGKLIAGGWFTSAGGRLCQNIARWDGSFWHPLGSGIDGGVGALAIFDDELIAAGSFETAGGVPCSNIARWDGSNWQPLGAGVNDAVFALVVYSGELIVGGWFHWAGGVWCANIARWKNGVWKALEYGTDDAVFSLTVYGGELLTGGAFTMANGVPCNHIAGWNGSSWHPLGIGMGAADLSPYVSALAAYNGQLIAGGLFLIAGEVPCNCIARWDGSAFQTLGSGIGDDDYYTQVYALTVYGGELIAGGSFTTAGGVECNNIARWNGSVWQAMGSGMNNDVCALTVYNGELIAGGVFTAAGGVVSNHIARWDGTNWQPLGSGMNSYVYALAICNSELIAGGGFTTAGGVLCNCVARWDGSSWHPLGEGMSGGGYYGSSVGDLAIFNGELIAGGVFTLAGGVNCNYIARWDGNDWYPLGEGMANGGYQPSVNALSTFNGELIAAGTFITAGGVPCNYIARWDGSAWQPLGLGIGPNYSFISELAVYNGELIAGGAFWSAGEHVSAYLARWRCPTVADCSLTCVPGSGTLPFTTRITITLNNSSDYTRREAGRVDVTIANGTFFSSWRSGFVDIVPLGSHMTSWNQVIPAKGSMIGSNVARMVVEDVTPSPWNQPPYPPSGDTDTDACTVTGIAP